VENENNTTAPETAISTLTEAEAVSVGEKIAAAKTPAARVIAAFGGQSRAAAALGMSRAAICLWNRETPRHGEQAGRIPSRQFSKILAAANARGIPLTAENLARFDD